MKSTPSVNEVKNKQLVKKLRPPLRRPPSHTDDNFELHFHLQLHNVHFMLRVLAPHTRAGERPAAAVPFRRRGGSIVAPPQNLGSRRNLIVPEDSLSVRQPARNLWQFFVREDYG